VTALSLSGVGLTRDGRDLLDGVDLAVAASERWVVLGPNGSGKSTLLRIAAFQIHPTRGTVTVLGATLGRVDIRRHRERIGWASAALADSLRASLTALDVVMTARHGALEPWWDEYTDGDRARAAECLSRMGVGSFADRTFGTLSSGERQRVLVARTLMNDPGLVLLDEPTAGLDLGARESLVSRLDSLAADPSAAPVVLVTHHVEEIPSSFTSVLLLRDGRIVAAGPLESTLTSASLSDTFGLGLDLQRTNGRWSATAAS
jgi:iron complex transport system ATP-binding protein